MDTDFSVNIITKQKVNEFRKEAQEYKLFSHTGASRRERVNIVSRFFSCLIRTPGIQQEERQINREESSRLEGSARI